MSRSEMSIYNDTRTHGHAYARGPGIINWFKDYQVRHKVRLTFALRNIFANGQSALKHLTRKNISYLSARARARSPNFALRNLSVAH